MTPFVLSVLFICAFCSSTPYQHHFPLALLCCLALFSFVSSSIIRSLSISLGHQSQPSTATTKVVASSAATTGTTTSSHTSYKPTCLSILESQDSSSFPTHLFTFPYSHNKTYTNGTPIAQSCSTFANFRNSFPPSSARPTLTIFNNTNTPVDATTHLRSQTTYLADLNCYLTFSEFLLQTSAQQNFMNKL